MNFEKSQEFFELLLKENTEQLDEWITKIQFLKIYSKK